MNQITYAIIALIAYSLVAPLVKLGTKAIPPEAALIITNSILVISTIIWSLIRGQNVLHFISLDRHAIYLYVAGIMLGVGITSYYMALGLGDVSRVVPIFGLYIALSSVFGFFLLGEDVTVTKLVGLVLAVVSIFLVSR